MFRQMWENVSHPDAAVTHDGRVRSAVGVDVGLWVVNSTFHLPEQEAIRVGKKAGRFSFFTVMEDNFDSLRNEIFPRPRV